MGYHEALPELAAFVEVNARLLSQIDPITLEVVRGHLVSTVLQMRATLVRTAYAPILYETRDFSCGLMTSQGELAA